MKMVIVFDGGFEKEFSVTEYKIERSRVTGEVSHITWKHPENAREIISHLDLSKICAIYRKG